MNQQEYQTSLYRLFFEKDVDEAREIINALVAYEDTLSCDIQFHREMREQYETLYSRSLKARIEVRDIKDICLNGLRGIAFSDDEVTAKGLRRLAKEKLKEVQEMMNAWQVKETIDTDLVSRK